jgi:hypothetical protein
MITLFFLYFCREETSHYVRAIGRTPSPDVPPRLSVFNPRLGRVEFVDKMALG